MDAANNTFKKTALFLTIALLLAAPFSALADGGPAFTFPNGSTATINGNQAGCMQINSTTSTQIAFTPMQQPPSTHGVVDPTLIYDPSSGLTTPVNLCFLVGATSGMTSGQHTITVALNSTNPSGITTNVTVVFNPNSSGGGGGGGTTGSGLTYVGANPIALSSTSGSVPQTSFALTNTTGGTISYSVTFSYDNTCTNCSWLIIPQSGQVGGGSQTTVTVLANPYGLSNGTHTASFTITYTGTGAGTINNVAVQFSVNGAGGGGGSGLITPSPSAVSWYYNSSLGTSVSQQIQNQNVSVTSSISASSYTVTVQPIQISGSNNYLVLANLVTVGTFPIGQTLVLTPTGNIAALSTGTYQQTVQISDGSGNTSVITVSVYVNTSQSGNGITISPAPITITAAVGQTSMVQTTIYLTSNTSGTVNLSVSGTGLLLANSSTTGSLSVTGSLQTSFILYANPSGLAANTYYGSLTATEGSASQTVQVNFNVGTSGGGGSSVLVAPTSLTFAYQQGQSVGGTQLAQTVVIGASGTFNVGTPTATWISVNPATSGTGPGTVTVSVNPSGLSTSATPYTGSFVITTPAGAQTINVSLLVTSGTVIFATPGVQNISYTAGTSSPVFYASIQASDGSGVPVTASSGTSWITLAQSPSFTTPGFVYYTINGSSLPNGINTGTITLTSSATNSSLNVPVVVTVSGSSTGGGGLLSLGTSAMTFNAAVNGSAPASQTLSVTASSATPYTASSTVSSGGTTWLSISPSGGLNTSSTSQLTASVNQSGLAVGTYSGQINLVTSAGTQTVSVTLVVSTSGGGGGGTGTLTATPSSLTFNYQVGGDAPAAQAFNVATTNSSGTSFTVTTSVANGSGWLSASPNPGFAPGAVSVSVSPTALSAGTYTGTVTCTPSSGTATSVPITLVVQGLPTVSASPTTLTMTYQTGSSTAPTATIQVSGTAANLSFTASAASSGNWLAVSPPSGSAGTSGTTLQVTTTPSGLTAGTYTGTITVAGTGTATGSTTINVTLTVTAPLPTISSVINAASGATAAVVSPGEIVSIFGPASNPIGPGTPAGLQTDSTGNNVLTTLGGVQVLFNGIPAPLTYVSATQINCVVPYGIAGLFAPYVQVKFGGQSSNAYNLTAVATNPGIFTQSGTGSGLGAILNSDGSVNGTSHAAAKGSVIVIYMTGEGATSPAGVTGKVNCPAGQSCSISQLPVPLLPVAVTLIDQSGGRYPANYQFAGEAPGFVSGVLQVNAVVPTTVPSGTLQIVVAVGSNSSQAGVTVVVQ